MTNTITLSATQKEFQASQFLESYNDYYDFREDFIETFKPNLVQTAALDKLCDLAAKYAKQFADMHAAGMTVNECVEIQKRQCEAVTA